MMNAVAIRVKLKIAGGDKFMERIGPTKKVFVLAVLPSTPERPVAAATPRDLPPA
jgi:hypothetical protein